MKMRAFIPDSTDRLSNRHYLSLLRVDVGEIPRGGGSHCLADSEDATQVSAARCPTLISLLPTFRNIQPPVAVPALWELSFADAADPNNTGLNENANVFIEFTVLNPAGMQAGPQLVPATYDLGLVPFQGSTTALAALSVTDDQTTQPWVLETVNITGTNASEFSVQVHGSRAVPFNLDPRGSFSLDLTATPSSPGHKAATLHLLMQHPDGTQSRTLDANLTAAGLPPATLTLLPPVVDFTHFPSATTLPWSRNVSIANEGQTDLHIASISLGGADASSFQLTTLRGSPVPASITTPPGGFETITVKFCPTRRGAFQAIFQVSGNAGDVSHPAPISGTLPIMANAPPDPLPLCH